MGYEQFNECHSLLRMLEVTLHLPYKHFTINIDGAKGRIEEQNTGKVPFITTWQTSLELAVTINAMIGVLNYKSQQAISA